MLVSLNVKYKKKNKEEKQNMWGGENSKHVKVAIQDSYGQQKFQGLMSLANNPVF